MGDTDESTPTADEFVEYCRTQARLLSGSVETMRSEAGDLLDDIDERTAEVRARLGRTDEVSGTSTPASADDPTLSPTADSPSPPTVDRNDGGVDVEAIEELESELEEKQALVDAKQARMRAFQELAAGYVDLAEELRADDGREALRRVVQFEADRDAPLYFDDRRTVYEAAASSDDADGSEAPSADDANDSCDSSSDRSEGPDAG